MPQHPTSVILSGCGNGKSAEKTQALSLTEGLETETTKEPVVETDTFETVQPVIENTGTQISTYLHYAAWRLG